MLQYKVRTVTGTPQNSTAYWSIYVQLRFTQQTGFCRHTVFMVSVRHLTPPPPQKVYFPIANQFPLWFL